MGQEMNDFDQTNTSLLSLPVELLLSILGHLELQDLCHLDQCCKWTRAYTKHGYKEWYGSGPRHRVLGARTNWKRMAREKNQILSYVGMDGHRPKDVLDKLLQNYHHCSDSNELFQLAMQCLVALQMCSERSLAFLEAEAAAYMAQGRQDEARAVYTEILQIQSVLPERAWLVAARFSEFSQSLPSRPSSEVKERAMFGAVASGNIRMIECLLALGVCLDIEY